MKFNILLSVFLIACFSVLALEQARRRKQGFDEKQVRFRASISVAE
jgi:hypothetical protein